MISVSVSLLCYLPIKSSEFMAHRSWKFAEKQRYLSGWLANTERKFLHIPMCTLCQCTYCSRQEEGIRIVHLVLDYHDDWVNNIQKSKDRLQASSMDENHGNQDNFCSKIILKKQKFQYVYLKLSQLSRSK